MLKAEGSHIKQVGPDPFHVEEIGQSVASTEIVERECRWIRVECEAGSTLVGLSQTGALKLLLAVGQSTDHVHVYTPARHFAFPLPERGQLTVSRSQKSETSAGDCPQTDRTTVVQVRQRAILFQISIIDTIGSCDRGHNLDSSGGVREVYRLLDSIYYIEVW